ncbi:hypothetical protein C8R47DRAFT_1157371 [Mycena vitilis]|nr:hypothetical protein C8R47DRAFT_1157371 [Mycena vitilis]
MGAAASLLSPWQMDFESMDLYTILEVSENASAEEIKRAYRRKALEHHPDKNQHDVVGATKRFNRVSEAYETLFDDNKRADYDWTRKVESEPAAKPFPPASFAPPGAWNEAIHEPTGPKQSWSEWLYGLAFRPSDEYSRRRFRPEIYAANNRHLDSGITMRTVYEFLKTLRDLDFSKDDHTEASAFKIVEDFFRCLAHDEMLWHNDKYYSSYRTPPLYGCGHYVWTKDDWDLSYGDPLPHEVHRFYEFWLSFKTLKSFEWVTPYTCAKWASPREQRYCRKMNKPYQERAKESYNKMIHLVVGAMKEHDPRYLMHLAIQHATQGRPSGSGHTDKKKKQKKKNKSKKR